MGAPGHERDTGGTASPTPLVAPEGSRHTWAPDLEFSPDELESLLAQVSDYLWSAEVVADGRFVYRYYSPAVETVTGRPPSYYLAGGWLETLYPDDRERVGELAGKLVRGEIDRLQASYRIIMPDGAIRWLHDRVVAVRERGKLILQGVVRDVTEQIEAEARARQMEEQVRRAERVESLGILAGGIAHDFNNQLATVLGGLDLVQMKLAASLDVDADIEQVQAAALRCAALCRQLLDFSGRGQFAARGIALAEFVEGCRATLAAALDHGQELELRCAPALPGIAGDPGQLQQALLNLVRNASEASGPGRVELRVEPLQLSPEQRALARNGARLRDGPLVCVEISDRGCGMDGETVERCFEPFFTTKPRGRGLGLAVVDGVVRGLEGAILIDSEPGRGTRVRLVLPAVEPSRSES